MVLLKEPSEAPSTINATNLEANQPSSSGLLMEVYILQQFPGAERSTGMHSIGSNLLP